MHEFAEEYVANLKPRDERYDTRLGDDFFVATFPNGIKTWSYVFQVNGYTRRQTLGVYPEMPLTQALEGLYAARRTRAVEADLAEQGMDGSQVRKTEDSPINLTAKLRVPKLTLPKVNRRFLAGVVTGSVISLSAVVAVWVLMGPTPVGEIAMRPVAGADPVPTIAATVVEDGLQHVGSEATTTITPEPSEQAPPVQQTAAEPEPTLAAVSETTASVEQTKPQELSKSQLALRRLQTDMAGTLAWAQLTSDIQNGEPVDQLSWVVELGKSPRRVFYFVRVRGLAGATVTYRWSHQGKMLKEDSVKVGQGWHSPAYSGMTLTTDRLGRWQVEVYGPDGQSLGSEEFETRMTGNTPQLSQR